MKEFIDEVNEELKWERILRFWKRYGTYLILGVVFFFGALSTWIYWEHHKEQKLFRMAAQYEQALENEKQGNFKGSLALLQELGKDPKTGYGVLALFKMGSLKKAQEKEGRALYQEIAANSSIEQPFRELALILDVVQAIDTQRPIDLAEKIRPIENENGPWRATALELLGLLLIKAGNISKATEVYENLSKDDQATPGIRARSTAFLDILRR